MRENQQMEWELAKYMLLITGSELCNDLTTNAVCAYSLSKSLNISW